MAQTTPLRSCGAGRVIKMCTCTNIVCYSSTKSGSRSKAFVQVQNLFTKYDQCSCSNGLRVMYMTFSVGVDEMDEKLCYHPMWCWRRCDKKGGVTWQIHVGSPHSYVITDRIKFFRPINSVVGNRADTLFYPPCSSYSVSPSLLHSNYPVAIKHPRNSF